MAEEKSGMRDILVLVLLAGVGVGGYFLWKYFKEEKPEDVKKGFNISKIGWSPTQPINGKEISITCIGKNKTAGQLDGYCKIINLDIQQEVFYDHAIVNPEELKGFTWTTIMPDELKLRFETGTLINGEQELNSYQEITIKAIVVIGKLYVQAKNTTADIYIDGKNTGEKTPHTFELNVGHYIVTLKAVGFRDRVVEIDIMEDTTSTIIVNLEPLPGMKITEHVAKVLYPDMKITEHIAKII